jgi:hypothetical protein
MLPVLPRQSDGGVRRLLAYRPIWAVLALGLLLNLVGIQWGLLNHWHADEVSWPTEAMVREHRVNPHYFMYGNIAFYRTALAVGPAVAYTEAFDPSPPPSSRQAHADWLERYQRRIALWPRVLSAIEGVVLVLLTYLVCATLFDRRVGLLSGVAMILSPTVIYIGHVATVDGFANVVQWLACLAAVVSWRRGGSLALGLSVFLAGVATGTKADHALVLIPVALAYAWRDHREWRHAYLLLLLPAGYLFANPVLLFSPFEFLDGLTRDMFFGAVQDTGDDNPYRLLLEYLWIGLGWPLFLLAAGALVYATLCIVRKTNHRELVWALSTFVPYYLLLGGRSVYPWYIEQLLPGITIVAAYGVVQLLAVVPRARRVAVQGALAVLAALAMLGPISLELQFTHDPRDAASRWIEEHVPANSTIFVSERGPRFPPLRYRVEVMLPDRERWKESALPVARLERHVVYRRVRHAILAAERWAGETFGTPVRPKPYHGWYDDILTDLDTRPRATERVMQVHPDFVVIVRGMSPTLLSRLRAPDSGYEEVAAFRYRSPVRGSLWMPMLNQPVWVFQRRDGAGLKVVSPPGEML